MKKILIITISAFLILTSLHANDPKEIYPWKTINISPSFSYLYLNSTGKDFSGHGLLTGLQVSDIYKGFLLGFDLGYTFLDNQESDFTPAPLLSFNGGYNFSLNNFLSVEPYIAYTFLYPIEDLSIYANKVLSLGAVLNLHLYDRHFLTINPSYNRSFGHLKDYLSFELGLKHEVPIMLKMPEPELNWEVYPLVFSPDGDNRDDILHIEMDVTHYRAIKEWFLTISDFTGSPIYFWAGEGAPPQEVTWDGYSFKNDLVFSASDYVVTTVIIDKLGNETTYSKPFLTDIFVQDINGILKIRVPSIVFSPGTADFSALSEDEILQNNKIIDQLSSFLYKFPKYRIVIEGHGNIINWKDRDLAEKEQVNELIPLSLERAKKIREALIEKGISGNRLDVSGKGGAEPIVSFSDESNRWMNRRVEFILEK